jgi:hypothetical protein
MAAPMPPTTALPASLAPTEGICKVIAWIKVSHQLYD